MKRKLTITIDTDTGSYELNTPDGAISFDLLGEVISDIILRFFDKDNPPEVNEDGVIHLTGTEDVSTEDDEFPEFRLVDKHKKDIN